MLRPQAVTATAGALLTIFLGEAASLAQTVGCCPSWQNACHFGNSFRCAPASCTSGTGTPSYASSLVQRELARKMALESSKLAAVAVYFERKLSNIDYRGKLKVARIRARFETEAQIANLKEEYANVIAANRRRAEEWARRSAPQRLSPGEYDAATGSVLWPPLLREDQRFAEDRARIDALFAQRTPSNSGLGSRNHLEIRRTASQMKDTLMAMQVELDGNTYTAVKRFLGSVAYEARFPVQPTLANLAAIQAIVSENREAWDMP